MEKSKKAVKKRGGKKGDNSPAYIISVTPSTNSLHIARDIRTKLYETGTYSSHPITSPITTSSTATGSGSVGLTFKISGSGKRNVSRKAKKKRSRKKK